MGWARSLVRGQAALDDQIPDRRPCFLRRGRYCTTAPSWLSRKAFQQHVFPLDIEVSPTGEADRAILPSSAAAVQLGFFKRWRLWRQETATSDMLCEFDRPDTIDDEDGRAVLGAEQQRDDYFLLRSVWSEAEKSFAVSRLERV